MGEVIFRQEANCFRESCEGCPRLKHDFETFGIAFTRKTKLRDGILCERLDPRLIRYVAPDRYEVTDDLS